MKAWILTKAKAIDFFPEEDFGMKVSIYERLDSY